jgi:hypothetical protein
MLQFPGDPRKAFLADVGKYDGTLHGMGLPVPERWDEYYWSLPQQVMAID